MKVVPDANIVIGFFRNPESQGGFASRTPRQLVYMSSVVALELYAGCRTHRREMLLANFLKPFEKAGRLILPDHASFLEAGRVLAKLGDDGIGLTHRRQIVNDVLIAVTAARAGMVVVTRNINDFSLIERYVAMRWMLPAQPQ